MDIYTLTVEQARAAFIHQIDSFCKRVMKCEAIDCKREYAHLSKKEVTFSNLSQKQMQQFCTEEEFALSHYYAVGDLDVFV